jgi:hypothetical protein
VSGARVRVGSKRVIDQRSWGRDDHPETFGAGRRCSIDGCETLLSTYNPGDVCALHDDGRSESGARRNLRRKCEETSGTCQLESCGREFVTTSRTRKYCSDRCRLKAFVARQRQTATSEQVG